MLEQLGQIDMATPWLQDLREMLEEAKEFIATSTSKTEKLRKRDTAFVRDMSAAASMAPNGVTEMTNELQAERNKIASILLALTKARDAAKLFVEKGKDFLAGVAKKTKTRIIGRATYGFRKAYEVDGRVCFRVENSGFELSNGDGIRVLERSDMIVNRMSKVYDDNPQLQRSVNKLMGIFQQLTGLLYTISVSMKSQRKWTPEDCDQFEDAARQYATLWLSFTGKTDPDETPIFNKLHVLVSHATLFVRNHGMLGRCSEEGFESSHKCIESVRKPLNCMTSTEARANTIYRRIMLQSRPDIESTFEGINATFTKAKRGPYNKDASRMKTADAAPTAKDVGGLSLPDGFIQSILKWICHQGNLEGSF
ncbi:hypothetical protein SEMRO_3044_G342720.1 [Seminavis robusta]|nr:hypothetical protein SEMRO_3044_G342720.1 [Seminavis robusta]|eukprot:Sro3044_g342720.1 n/a (367) ;mRNA; f:4992-6092